MTSSTVHRPADRPLYGHAELRRLIDPRSIAVIGASQTPGSFGMRTLDNIRVGYAGRIFPVNPRYRELASLPCFPSLEALPEVPDCVIVIVPGEQVEGIVDSAAKLGVGGVIVYSAGFAEARGEDGAQAQQRMVERARAAGVRLLGPNCVGMVNFVSRVGMTFMPKFHEMPMRQGSIGLISQSGALGYCVLQAMQRSIGFSHYLSPGNSCDVDVCDLINYLVDDPDTRVIACMFEGVQDGGRLMEAARRALAANKPLLIYKMAHDEIGRRTAMSHTGTMAGARIAYEAAFARTGVVRIDCWEEMLECASFFARAGEPAALGVGIMAASGGAAVMGADKAAEFHLALPEPHAETRARLAAAMPDFGSTANPCDLTAESLKSIEMYGQCIRAFAEDPSYAVVVVPMMSAHRPTSVDRAEALSRLADDLDTPLCLVWLNEWLEGPGSEVYDASPRIAMFRSMTRCMKAIRLWMDHYQARDRLLAASSNGSAGESVGRSTGWVESARELLGGGTGALSESRSKAVLAACGVPVTVEAVCPTADEAARAASRIGFPVALKIDSADIPHKTEAGVVRLGLCDAEEVESVATELLGIASRLPGAPRINGVLVQQMAAKGMEMMIGVRRDPQFGPVVVCGFGGVDVEIDRDVAASLAPVSRDEAERMIRSLRKARLLDGYRGKPGIDIPCLADAVSRVSSLALDLQDRIAEIDVNPFIVGVDGGMAVDALIVTEPSNNHEH